MANASNTAAGFVVFRKTACNIQYLLLQTSYGQHHWTPPKGYVEETDESELDTAYRETYEESGLTKDDLEVFECTKFTMQYRIPPDNKLKTVIYWLAELTNESTSVRLSEEHQCYKWAELEDALELGHYSEMKELLCKYDEYIRTELL